MAGLASAADHDTVKNSGGCVALAGVLLALSLAACGGDSAAPGTAGESARSLSTPTSSTSSANGAPVGGPAPEELQGTWLLVSKKNAEKGLQFIISEHHYRVPRRFAHGDLVVDGNEIAFFNAAICGLTLPEGVGHYRWTIEGELLRFEPIGEEPCGGRGDILEDATYKRIR